MWANVGQCRPYKHLAFLNGLVKKKGWPKPGVSMYEHARRVDVESTR